VKIRVRLLGPDDSDAFTRTFRTFMVQPSPGPAQLEARRPLFAMSRSFGACEGDEVVGTAAAWPCDMVVPGGARVDAGAVTGVGVLPTHTRQGILTNLMRTQLDDVAEQGQVAAILYASESIIYGRFGYGIATTAANLSIEMRHAAFRDPWQDPGRLRLVSRTEALQLFPVIFEEFDRGVPGSINRPLVRWEHPFMYGPVPDGEPTPHEVFVVHEDANGALDGAMTYEVLNRDAWWGQLGYIELHDLFGSRDAYVALWRHALDLDLAGGVKFDARKLDEPLRWMLADPRRLEMRMHDQLWLRLLDVPAALRARIYGRAGRVVLDVADPFLGRGGRFEVDADESGQATCKRSRRSADLELTLADLGTVYLGGHSFAALAAASRVTEQRAGALARADQLFAHHPLPWCGTFF